MQILTWIWETENGEWIMSPQVILKQLVFGPHLGDSEASGRPANRPCPSPVAWVLSTTEKTQSPLSYILRPSEEFTLCAGNGISAPGEGEKGWGCWEEEVVISSWERDCQSFRAGFKSAHERREMGLNRQDTVRACQVAISPEAMAQRVRRVRHGPGKKEHRSIWLECRLV